MSTDASESEQAPQSGPDSDAEFLGWQETHSGEVIALYNITAAGHPSCGSTVTDKGLLDLNLRVPDAPAPQRPVKKL